MSYWVFPISYACNVFSLRFFAVLLFSMEYQFLVDIALFLKVAALVKPPEI